MIADQQRFNRAIASFDATNREDPNRELVDGRDHAKELLYAERMSAMLKRYAVEASEALQLAARCQHIRRWEIPRASYAMTKAGYYQWRMRLRDFHAGIAAAMLRQAGYEEDAIARVCSLVKKESLQLDEEGQILEDVIVLVFLVNYLEDFVRSHSGYDEAKLLDILRKTLKKMSARGREAALTMIELPPSLLPTIRKAIG